jgi:hypothetical protein
MGSGTTSVGRALLPAKGRERAIMVSGENHTGPRVPFGSAQGRRWSGQPSQARLLILTLAFGRPLANYPGKPNIRDPSGPQEFPEKYYVDEPQDGGDCGHQQSQIPEICDRTQYVQHEQERRGGKRLF